MKKLKKKRGNITGLEVKCVFEDKDTYDIDFITIGGNNRNEISVAIENLLVKKGILIYGRIHKWKKLIRLL